MDAADYCSYFLHAHVETSSDSGSSKVRVPISVTHHKRLLAADAAGLGRGLDGSHNVLLSGYGAYGSCVASATGYAPERLRLLREGWVVAHAHVRGGAEFGREWYHDGKLMNKENSFGDFIRCAEELVQRGYCSAGGGTEGSGRPDGKVGRIVAEGASAGGLLVAVAMERRPELFGAVIAKVPFVDVLTSMCDPSLPLTQHEYDEWGDPTGGGDEERGRLVRDYIARYDPYVQAEGTSAGMGADPNRPGPDVGAQGSSDSPLQGVAGAAHGVDGGVQDGARARPALLVTTSLNDHRVPYWGPAKWVARLRGRDRQQHQQHQRTDDPLLLLKVDQDGGHFGGAGTSDYWEDVAFEHAFMDLALGNSKARQRE
jgi:oligopeptidase B